MQGPPRRVRRLGKFSSVTGLLDARLSPNRPNGWADRAWAIAVVQVDEAAHSTEVTRLREWPRKHHTGDN